MQHFIEEKKSQPEHIASIYKEYTTPSRVLRSFTNIANTVIQTALSGQNKYLFEILQNADDAYEDENKSIEVKLILKDKYLIVHHNGKGFDFNDVERICDYASQIEEVKATDLRKTGYKGLGFKSLFNLSDCIYIHSNGYSFRFDKGHWPDPESKPWQVIPIWCKYEELPLIQLYPYDERVNIILKVNDVTQLESQLRELVHQPELLLYMFRINELSVNLNEEKHFLERRIEKFGVFKKIDFYNNRRVESSWLSKDYIRPVSTAVQTVIQGASRFIYPERIKNAQKVKFTFALRSDITLKEISRIRGLCYSTLPTQLHLTLPYHVNSLFILNLDRTQLHENEWNEFLVYQLGYLQFNLLKDLAEMEYLKNYVVQLFVGAINHPYIKFNKAFYNGFMLAKGEIGWLPPFKGNRLLKLGEVWTDATKFFKQNFQHIWNSGIIPYLISYEVKDQHYLSSTEARHFTYDDLLRDFPDKYYPQLTRDAYKDFITYLYTRLKKSNNMYKLCGVRFLVGKDGALQTPQYALLEESQNPIPNFFLLNTIDNDCLPLNGIHSIKEWLTQLGARRLLTPIQILRESVLKWIDYGHLGQRINTQNHIGILNYLAQNFNQLTIQETQKLKENLLILTESKQFKPARLCYFPDAVSVKELLNISNNEKISSSYNMHNLRKFFILVGVTDTLKPIDVLRRSILIWIRTGEINYKFTKDNYKAIIEFMALHFPAVHQNLTVSEMTELKNMPVLTCGQTFQKARDCYFDSSVPKIKGFEDSVAKSKLVSTNHSKYVTTFLAEIGVSSYMAPRKVIQEIIIKWIQKGDARNKVTEYNHHDILKYIGKNWNVLSSEEQTILKKMPILTESGAFREAHSCYRPVSNLIGSCKEIPGLKSVISSDEFISKYYDNEEIMYLSNLGVRILGFTDIYEKYSDHLNHSDNLKWFFSQLVNYWESKKAYKLNDHLLIFVQRKFRASSCLLAKNGQMCSSTEIYSSQFDNIYDIDKSSMIMLQYDKLPGDLEKYLGFKSDLDLKCIKQLLEAIGKHTELGQEKTLLFFTTMLEQLRKQDKNEIIKSQLKLLSSDNTLKMAKYLNYFIEVNAICSLKSCYLKRIFRMSHKDTLELAKLCGVNTIPFHQDIIPEKELPDDSLKEFYLERLPFIVLQESKELCEDISVTLKRLYEGICAIKFFQCHSIHLKYPFGDVTKVQHIFEGLTLYVVGKWNKRKTKIHEYLKEKLGFKTDIANILDMEPITQNDKEEWLDVEKHCSQKFELIENLLKTKTFLLNEGKEKINTTSAAVLKKVSTDSTISGDTSSNRVSGVSASVTPDSEKLTAAAAGEPATAVPALAESTSAEPISGVSTSVVPITEKITVGESTSTAPFSDPPSSAEPVSAESTSEESDLGMSTSVATISRKPTHFAWSTSGVYVSENTNSIHQDATVPTAEEIDARIKSSIDSISDDDVIEVDMKILISSEFETDLKKQILLPGARGSNYLSTGNLRAGSSRFLKEVRGDISDINWLSEKFVFICLQEHYINKYPNSQFTLSDEIFTLRGPSKEIEIVRINARKKQSKSYDFLLKNENEQRFIKVKLPYDRTREVFTICHCQFTSKIRKLAAEIQDHKVEDFIEGDSRLNIQSECKTDRRGRVPVPEIQCANLSIAENVRDRSSRITTEAISEPFGIKWKCEKFVFNFLQDHYKSKYPESQFNLSDGSFTLQWRSNNIEIVWINASEEKGFSYDIILKKEGEVKRLIEVKSTNSLENKESFNINHRKFIEKSQISAESPDHKGKYCIYLVYNANYSTTALAEELYSSTALYKVVLLRS